MPYIAFNDFSGGMSDFDPWSMPDTRVAEAYNLTYFNSPLGARRNGISSLSTTATQRTVAMFPYTPDSTTANERLVTAEMTGALATEWKIYTPAYARSALTPAPADLFDAIGTPVSAVNLRGLLIVACFSVTSGSATNNRLHGWDGTNFRRLGIAPALAAPTSTDTGVGAYSGTRYFRVRFTVESGGVAIRRSEPSPVLTDVPSGTGTGIIVTRPTAPGEGETHWELEESIDNANFYKINASIVIATTTSTSSTAYSAVPTSGTLSAVAGTYTVPPSARYVVVDRDRLVGFGNFSDASRDSEVFWTAVGNDTTAVGNAERVPTATGNTLQCDTNEGGRLTGAIHFNGSMLAFKANRTYLITHTGQRSRAYVQERLSNVFGALEGSIFEGLDAAGRPCIYFYDPDAGPMRYGSSGFERLAPHLQKTLDTVVDQDPERRVVYGQYHPDKQEAWFYLKGQNASGLSPDWPQMRLVYNAVTGGSNFHTLSASVPGTNGGVFSVTRWQGYPIMATHNSSGATALGRADDPAATTDLGLNYRAYTKSKAIEGFDMVPGLNGRFQLKNIVLRARPTSGVAVSVSPVKDYGLETMASIPTATLTAVGSEPYVIVSIDHCVMHECTALQIEFGDATARSVAAWDIARMGLKLAPAGENRGS